MRIASAYMLAPLMLVAACRKKPDPVDPPAAPGLNIVFENYVGDRPLKLDSETYLNANGDSFTVSTYKYYITNIKLQGAGGLVFAEPESYHLVDESKKHSGELMLQDMPAGSYTHISFLLGVDSARNVSGAQKGALDPAHGMFWDWNTGYIMALMEGKSPQAKPELVAFHMGGFYGPNNVVRKVTLQLPEPAVAIAGKTTQVTIKSDLAEWFKTPATIDFSKLSIVATPEEDAKMIADNYADMFSVLEVK